jgi:hypothetical protein
LPDLSNRQALKFFSMNQTPVQETCPAELPNWCAQRHWSIFWILIVCSLALVTGRVLIVENHRSVDDTPFFSANDRSRWCTVRALGDQGVYEIDFVNEKNESQSFDNLATSLPQMFARQ